MIIGLSGLAGSGKDAAADVLINEFNFARIALADPMKRFLSELFQFTDVQLYGPSEERNKPDKRYPRFDEKFLDSRVAEWHKEEWHDELEGVPINEYMGLTRDEYAMYVEHGNVYLTPRLCLQMFGTNWGRTCYLDIWAEYAVRIAKVLLDGKTICTYDQRTGLSFLTENKSMPKQGVVISDLRYKSEILKIKSAGGKIVRIKRGTTLSGDYAQHSSETEQLTIPDEEFDYIIDNMGTLDDLKNSVRKMKNVI